MTSRLLFFTAWAAALCVPPCLAAVPSSRPAAPPIPLNPAIRDLFEQLAAPAPRLREDAMQRLANYGTLIRPALLEAARTGEPPELRIRAATLLCRLEWSTLDDAPAVRQMLSEFRNSDPDIRSNAARRLFGAGDAAFTTLLRLLAEDPSEDVRWTITRQLRNYADDAQRERLRAIDPGDDPPALAAVGWGWLALDPDKSARFLRAAVDGAMEHAADTEGEAEIIRELLKVRAINVGDYEEVIEQERRLAMLGNRTVAEGMLEVLVAHAQYGPGRSLAQDLKLAGDTINTPEAMYVMGRIHERLNEPLLATACYHAAGLGGLSTQQAHLRVGEFLFFHRWYDLAEVEFRAVLATTGPNKDRYDLAAYVRMSKCAEEMREDDRAAELLTTMLHAAGAGPNRIIGDDAEYRAEIAWHLMRAAKSRGDWAEVGRQVDAMAPATGQNGEAAIERVAALKHLKRDEEAAKSFAQIYGPLRELLALDPHNPEFLNNLAWVCARCDEHIEEAVKWSAEAVRLAPAVSAYLDTAAEAVAHQGKWDEAVRLENEALRLTPGEKFMMMQRERFQREGGKAREAGHGAGG